MCFFQSDARYRRFLAVHPGVWDEVGVYDDPAFLAELLAERSLLGLPPRPCAPSRSRPLRPRARGAKLRVGLRFASSLQEIGS